MEKITFLNFRKGIILLILILGFPIYPSIVSAFYSGNEMPATIIFNSDVDTDGDGIPDHIDIDDDNDGILDVVEGFTLDSDGDGIPNYLDLDSDGDGLLDNYEAQFHKTFQLPSGIDSDENGLDDAYESVPGAGEGITPIDTDSDGVPDYLDMDSDNDGILDQNESSVISEDFDCNTVPKLNFGSEPVLESGVALTEGAVYRYQQVTNNLDALVTIEKVDNGEILYFDQNATDPEFFKPEIYFTTTSTDRRPYVDFRISFVEVGTNTPVILEELSANFLDVDGNAEYQEYNRFNTPASYTLDENNEITVQNTTGGFLVNGGSKEYDGISNQVSAVNVAVEFVDIDSFVFRFGIQADVDNNFKTNVARQAGIQFTCLDNFNNPQTTNFSVDVDSDNDGYPDRLDIDSDNDGIPDNVEAQPTFGYIPPSGQDVNGNGVDDAYESGDTIGLSLEDTDSDGTPDYLDDDSDNDWVPDNNEGNDFNFDGIPDWTFTGTDTDGDGLDDGYEGSDVNDGFDVNDEIEDPATDLPDRDGKDDVNYRDIDDDGDGIPTPEEDANGDGDPTNDDTDGDGTPDYLDPTDETDTDGDGVPDDIEEEDETDPLDYCDYIREHVTVPQSEEYLNGDCDGDGVTNQDEETDGTDPFDPCDYNPESITLPQSGDYLTADCDGDGVTNGDEEEDGTDPNDACDFVLESQTVDPSSTWHTSDCDGDGVTNEDEVEDGTDPLDPCDYNPESVTLPRSAEWEALDCDGDGNPNGSDPDPLNATARDDSGSTPALTEVAINILENDDYLPNNDATNLGLTNLSRIGGDASGTLTLDAETGILTYTPVATESNTTVTIVYQVCNINVDPNVCASATVYIEVGSNVLDAVEDTYVSNGDGDIADSNVLSNDTLNGEQVSLEDVILSSTPTDALTINEDGSISVAPGTIPGTYTIDYTICEIANVNNCDTATVTVEVEEEMGGSVIDAVEDSYIVNVDGEIADSNVLSNDTLNGEPVSLENVILSSTPTDALTINEDGSISVAPGTIPGTFTIDYTICEIANVDNCDSATVTVTVEEGMGGNLIDAVDDSYTVDSDDITIDGSNVLLNDTLNGEPVTLENVILTSTSNSILTINENGSVTIEDGIPPGTYTIEYTICEIANVENCDTATVTVIIDEENNEEGSKIEVNQLLTPNGDLKNDFLFIRGVDKIRSSTLRIFNRWGVAVYEGTNYDNINNVFDGRSRGRSSIGVNQYLPAGVYFYIFNYETDEGSFTDSEYIYISR
ncbi:gliding motility-associated C-terminal domain-containing protein [Allomuricauda sp. NBRC 101325]|uniref:T9SS type B sorting domain-containing protein n=1 Tax=Allomuricauda sp. NBRC 101325 TaxID=1113758 RepID=UPI0025552E3D|nr:gliding motility-associated C-terminal domain-containing protein [Muricauda sp. NBRC 101325]